VGPTAGSEHTYTTQSVAPTLSGNLPDGKLFGLVYGFAVGPWFLGTTNLNGEVTTFHQFPSGDVPFMPIYGAGGNYYAVFANPAVSETTSYFYHLTPSGSFTQLATLPFIPTALLGGGLVLQSTDGNFYGIQFTGLGCASYNQHGGLYRLTWSGQYTLLHDFGVCGKAVVNSLIEGSDGNLYGVTSGNSRLTTSGAYKELFQLNGANGMCDCGLLQGSDGIIYGAASGGETTGAGVVFALDLPRPQAQAPEFTPKSGAVGSPVRIWGYNLLKSSVSFNGVPAAEIRHAGPTYVWANVPAGARTGPIVVTTPGGASTTTGSFTVE
jgi:hypothetical protein